MKNGFRVTALLLAFLLAACGGGGGGSGSNVSLPIIDLPVLSPSDSRTYENPNAIDPLASFRAVQFSASSKFDYRREVPENGLVLELNPSIAPNADMPDDTLVMVNRAFKLWSRRIDSLMQPGGTHQSSPHIEPGTDGKVRVDISLGYPQVPGGGLAGANHYGDSNLEPHGRSGDTPVAVYHQEFFNHSAYTSNNKLTADGFRVLAHEAGHIFNYEAPDGHYHADCDGEGIMCDRWVFRDQLDPVGPAEQDFDGIRHHYNLKPDSDFEEFGIWATVRNADSDLNEFGVKVTRTLIANPVVSNNRRTTEGYVSDQINVETTIRGTANNGPVTGMGTASWSGDLIAVDTNHFQPILGDVDLTMDLSNVDSLEASFTDMERTDDAGMRHNIADAGYTLMKSGSTYLDDQGIIDANFYAVGTDVIGAVAGRLDDNSRNLMGVYGAIRDGIISPPQQIPMMPQ